MAEDKKTEQGEVDEPQEIAAEDVVGSAEAPTEDQADREQQVVAESTDEAQQKLAQETDAAPADSQAALGTGASPTEADAIEDDVEQDEPETPRVKPAIPGADLEVDIVREGEEALRGGSLYDEDAEDEGGTGDSDVEDLSQPIPDAAIDLAADARYRATGKRKTAVARVTLKPGTGAYVINGRTLEVFFPRNALQRTIRQPLETVGYETRMDVIASMHGGGVAAQAGALRHGISRALLEADPNLRAELKRRGFLTRDARVKERKKAGLKKARKRPQFSKR
jgi:small subunit ribosomal protein S9